jgi:hypothetical protein
MDWPPNLLALRLLVIVEGSLGLLSRSPRNGEVDTFFNNCGFSDALLVIGALVG